MLVTTHQPLSAPPCVCACVCVNICSLAESEPEDPLELIEEHKGAEVTPREGDENTPSGPVT